MIISVEMLIVITNRKLLVSENMLCDRNHNHWLKVNLHNKDPQYKVGGIVELHGLANRTPISVFSVNHV